MKGIDILCASQASTAISHSMMDQASSSSYSNVGGRAIDRHNPIITDSRRTPSRDLTSPSSPKSPFDPKPFHDHQKAKKKSSFSKESEQNKKKNKKKSGGAEMVTENNIANSYSCKPVDSILKKKSWVRPPSSNLATTPAGSSRYLLSDTAGSSSLALTMVNDHKKAQLVHQDETNHATNSVPSTSSSSVPKSADQVVVLRVSLHCKGCEGKVRKHLSRMQGVRSFNIDFAAKKVTVVGDVTPLSVLASISKVKNAQIWPASSSALDKQGNKYAI